MTVNRTLFDAGVDIHPGTAINADANSDITGDRINLSLYDRAYYLVVKPAGTAGDNLSFQFLQHTDATGGSSKALQVSRLWHKIGTLTDVGQWTQLDLATPASSFDLAGIGLAADTSTALILVEVPTDSLDTSGGYHFVSVNHEGDTVMLTLLVNGLWILTGSRYPQERPISPLV